MQFFTTDMDGVTLIEPDARERRSLLESVTESDADYPEVFLTHQCGTVLSYRSGGILVREEDGEVGGFIEGVNPKGAAQAWEFLVSGDFDALKALPWKSE